MSKSARTTARIAVEAAAASSPLPAPSKKFPSPFPTSSRKPSRGRDDDVGDAVRVHVLDREVRCARHAERDVPEDALAEVQSQDEVALRVDRHEVRVAVAVHVGNDDLLRRESRVARLRRHVGERAVEVVAEKLIGLAAAEEVDVEVAVEVEIEKHGSGERSGNGIRLGRARVLQVHSSKNPLDALFGRCRSAERHGNRRARACAQPFLHLRGKPLDGQPHDLREHLAERLLVTRRHAQDVLEDADLDGRALDVAAAEERPRLREELTRARVAVRDERIQLRETLRQRGAVSRLSFEDEELQARGQVRGRAGDDLGEARAARGLFGRRRGRVRLHVSREPPTRLEVARVEGRSLLESGAGGGGPVSLVLENSANRLKVRPIPQREGFAEESFRARKILLAQRRDRAVRERQRFTGYRVRQLRERRARFLRPLLLELREAHVAHRQDARRLLGGEPGRRGFSAEEEDGRAAAAARTARAAQPLRPKRDLFIERGLWRTGPPRENSGPRLPTSVGSLP